MSDSAVCDDENRFALVRERIMARRNWEKLTRETRQLAEMEDWELDVLERSLPPIPLTTSKVGKLGKIYLMVVSIRDYLIGVACALISCTLVLSVPKDMCLHRSCLILAVVAASNLGGLRAGMATSAVSAAFVAVFLSASDSGRIIWIAMMFSIPSMVSSYPRHH